MQCCFLTFPFSPVKDPSIPACSTTVDIGFILDSSGSLANDYGKEKDFLVAIAKAFGIGPSASRAGVVTFSYNSELSIKMNDYQDINSFQVHHLTRFKLLVNVFPNGAKMDIARNTIFFYHLICPDK